MFKKISLGIAAMLAVAATSAHAIEISVTPWLAPNAFGSPSFPGAEANAVQAMYQNLPAFGSPGTPTYFQAQSNVTSTQAIVTGFPSWLGLVDPGTVFGSGFAGELGNRMTFALRIDGQGNPFSISQLSFSATSSDPLNALAFAFGTGNYNYGSGYVGVLKGNDGLLGTGDDIFITSGLNTQLVDELVGRGSGNSFAAYCPGCSLADQQAAIDAAAAYPGFPFTFTGTYCVGDSCGSGTFNIAETPIPAALPLFAGGLGIIGLVARRKKRKNAAALAFA